jgi:hypothetical protein
MIDIDIARKWLGKKAEGVPDEVLLSEMRTAEILKDLFFAEYRKIIKSPGTSTFVPE